MKSYLAAFIIILCAGCANNWLNLKQGEFIRVNNHPISRPAADIPLTTYHTLLSERTLEAYTQAIDWINAQAGCQIFKHPVHAFVDPPRAVYLKCWNRVAENDFIWGSGNTEENEDLGLCVSKIDEKTNKIVSSTVHIPCYRPFPEVEMQVAVHELLHTLGLGHDRELGTIMYHNHRYAALELQDVDLKFIKTLYCQGK